MPFREFADAEGMSWKVWATYPTVGRIYSSGFEEGWLTFEGGGQRCRLAPIPAHWDSADERKLRLMLKAAKLAKRPTRNAESLESSEGSDSPVTRRSD